MNAESTLLPAHRLIKIAPRTSPLFFGPSDSVLVTGLRGKLEIAARNQN
jgi:hypothetical protein